MPYHYSYRIIETDELMYSLATKFYRFMFKNIFNNKKFKNFLNVAYVTRVFVYPQSIETSYIKISSLGATVVHTNIHNTGKTITLSFNFAIVG